MDVTADKWVGDLQLEGAATQARSSLSNTSGTSTVEQLEAEPRRTEN